MWYTASALNFRSCHEMRYISLQKTDGRKFVSFVSQRVTDICIHRVFFEFSNAPPQRMSRKGWEKNFERDIALLILRGRTLSSDVYLESFTAIILFPLERGEVRPIVMIMSEAFHESKRQCTYTCPFVERDVVCLTNRVWPYVRQTACAAINWFKYWSSILMRSRNYTLRKLYLIISHRICRPQDTHSGIYRVNNRLIIPSRLYSFESPIAADWFPKIARPRWKLRELLINHYKEYRAVNCYSHAGMVFFTNSLSYWQARWWHWKKYFPPKLQAKYNRACCLRAACCAIWQETLMILHTHVSSTDIFMTVAVWGYAIRWDE